MVKMNRVTNLNAQQISRLNEHILVANKIQKAGHNMHQGNGLLRNKLLNPSGGGGATTLPPLLNLEGFVFANRFASMLAQNDHDSRSVVSPLTPKSPLLKDPQHGNGTPIDSAALGRSALRLQHERVEKSTQLLCNGGLSKGNTPRLPMPQGPPPATPLAVVKVVAHPNQTHFLKVTPHTYPFPCTSGFLSRKASLGFGFGGLDIVAVGQMAREDLLTTKEKTPSSKQE
jgi:hypothetical protein